MNQWFSFITGIFTYLAGVLTLVPVNNRDTFFSSLIHSTSQLILLIVIGLVLIGLWFLFCQWLGNKILTKGENTPHNVQVVPLPDSERKFEGNVIRYFAPLKLINKEKAKITNCYAVIRKATPTESNKDSTSMILGSTSKRLRWSDNQNSPNFEITIGAEKGEATLYVYQTAINLISNSPVVSDFCTNNPDIIRLGVAGSMNIYDVEIDFFGNVGTEELKLDSFIGHIETAIIQSEGEISCPLRVYSGNIGGDIQSESSEKNPSEIINKIVFSPESRNIEQIPPNKTTIRNIPPEYYRPDQVELAYHIGIEIQKFWKQFQLSRGVYSSMSGKYSEYVEAKALLDKIVKDRLPQSNMIFGNSDEIKELVETLNFKSISYGNKLSSLEYLNQERVLWGNGRQKPPNDLIDSINKTYEELWGDGQLYEQVMTIVYKLISLLKQIG